MIFRTAVFKAIVALGSVFVFLIFQGCSKAPEQVEEVVRPVLTTLVVASSADQSRTLPGKVQAAERVNLSFQVAGPLVELPVSKGQNVEKGQLLAKIDPRDFKSKLKAAEAQFKNAKSDLDRALPLVKKNLVSKSDMDRFRARFDISEADLERARKAMSDTNINAPFSGAIADIFVENFQDVQAKEKVLSLQDNSSLEIIVQVPEKEIVTSGKNEMDINAYFEAVPGRAFPATIKEFSTEADPGTQTYEVVLAINAPTDIYLLPGMSASVVAVKHSLSDEQKRIYVPATAVFNDPAGKDKQFVWLVKEGPSVTRQAVKVGSLANSQIEIVSGLTVGQRIVVSGVHYLVEGQNVKLIKDQI